MINVLLSSFRLSRKLQTSAIIVSAQNKTIERKLLQLVNKPPSLSQTHAAKAGHCIAGHFITTS